MTIDAKNCGRIRFRKEVVKVASIEVEPADRRYSEGYIDLLSAIISKYGLMQPIITHADGRLLAGAHLLAAVKRLGWETVEVHVVEPN
jgi:ParB-like chromosome segregation protein Spo0J